jgi:hypothetical protein
MKTVTELAQQIADQELEACVKWLNSYMPGKTGDQLLRPFRRPKPPSLKEQALLAIDTAVADYRIAADVADVVRRALEQLPDNEPSGNSR